MSSSKYDPCKSRVWINFVQSIWNVAATLSYSGNLPQSEGSHMDWKTGKTWKKTGDHFPVREVREFWSDFEKSGNFTQNIF